jgi:hypothetical protein
MVKVAQVALPGEHYLRMICTASRCYIHQYSFFTCSQCNAAYYIGAGGLRAIEIGIGATSRDRVIKTTATIILMKKTNEMTIISKGTSCELLLVIFVILLWKKVVSILSPRIFKVLQSY